MDCGGYTLTLHVPIRAGREQAPGPGNRRVTSQIY